MADFEIDERVDITDVVCPMTFVKAKVAMEEIEVGQVLAVTMNEGEPVQNVPRSFKEEGQQILKLIDNENGTYEQDFLIQKGKNIVPIEVKAETNIKSKSLKAFCDKYNPNVAVRFSTMKYVDQGWMKNIPLYAVCNL